MGHNMRLGPIPSSKIFSPAQSPKPTAECPLFPQLRTQRWSIASVSESRLPRSAFPSGADVPGRVSGCLSLTQSGHPSWSRYMHSVGAETQVSPAGAAVYRLGLLLFVAITLRSRGRPIGSIRAAGPSGLVGALISSCLFGSHTEYKSEYSCRQAVMELPAE